MDATPDTTPTAIATDSDPGTADRATVERQVDLDVAAVDVVGAVHDPDDLGRWLGEWQEDPDGTRVRTDDGHWRRVDRIDRRRDGASWRWWPEGDPERASDVEIRVVPLGVERSRVVVTETSVAGPAISASAAHGTTTSVMTCVGSWPFRLLVLELRLVARSAAVAVA